VSCPAAYTYTQLTATPELAREVLDVLVATGRHEITAMLRKVAFLGLSTLKTGFN
jgi:hypothetical protein